MEITIEFDEKSNLDEVIVAAKASMIEKILKYQDIMEKYQELNTNFSRYTTEHFGVIPRSEYDKAAARISYETVGVFHGNQYIVNINDVIHGIEMYLGGN